MMSPRFCAPLASLLLLAGCATVPGQDRLAERDPYEKFNRGVWGVNQAADKALIKPVAQAYRAVAPRPVRQGVSNFFANLSEPWSFINNVLQGKPNRAGKNFGRFVINSTIGLGGLIDVATKMKIEPAYEDFGQTMARWGVNGGPYLVLPILGPSTLRDAVGTGVAAYADPVNIAVNNADVSVWYKRGYRVGYVISLRSDLIESGGDAFLQSALDPYATARSAFLQRRRASILDQEGEGGSAGPDDEMPSAEGVPQPAGNADALPPEGAVSAAPLPGHEPVAAPASTESTPASAAPLPGDDTAPEAPKPNS